MRLLFAEDEVLLSNVLVTLLEKNNYSVDAVFNGRDALDRLETEVYDGAILDIMMPQLDGISVLKQIRAQGNSLPVLLLTAKAEIDDTVYGLDCGANDYLSKPFDSKELLARIRAMLKNKNAPATPVLALGNVVLDRTAMELRSATNSFRLSVKEFQLMELFMHNPNRLLYPRQIQAKIWENDASSNSAAVEMYINFLNKKLYALRADIEVLRTEDDAYILEGTGRDR